MDRSDSPAGTAASGGPGAEGPLDLVIEPKARDLDGLPVARVLPAVARQTVGPFIFLDHFGPAVLRPPLALDVRPHPHIGLATVTYLLEGEILHRDSLGSAQVIRPGAVNWMTAGRGIVHSERTPPGQRGAPAPLHGLQLWVALPREHEEAPPAFHHLPAEALPLQEEGGVRLRVLAGEVLGVRSPASTHSPLFLADVALPDGARVPLPPGQAERGVYVVSGRLRAGGASLGPGRLAVLRPGSAPPLAADGPARLLLLGGAPLGEPRHAWWNFVSSSRERIEQAKADWAAGRFPKVPGDELEYTPLPASPAIRGDPR